MSAIGSRIDTFRDDESGATFLEYTLIVGVVSLALLSFFSSTIDALERVFSEITQEVDDAA